MRSRHDLEMEWGRLTTSGNTGNVIIEVLLDIRDALVSRGEE